MNRHRKPFRVLALSLLLVQTACSKPTVAPLPKLDIDRTRIAVAGLSSGAYMATQVHLAYSNHLLGAALVAGGPYGCAQGSLETALGPCISGAPKVPDGPALAGLVQERVKKNQLAPLSGLAGDRVLVLHGSNDKTVAEGVSRASANFYGALAGIPDVAGMSVRWDGDRAFGHTLPTEATGSACAASEPPYLGRCGFDAAGTIMRELFADADRKATQAASGELRRFNQESYLPDGKDAYLADSGYVYVPKTCAGGTRCGLLIAFHGCQQNAAKVGEAFVRDAGFNRWADAMDVVVLYPQTRSSYLPLNPKACWDWWGYSGADYDTRSGVQLRWLANATAALGAPLE